jgi:hypothetical protein
LAVYVDQPIFPFGRMMMCHMWADGLDELHAFATRLDPRLRAHFQAPPRASWEHYDIGKGLRARALSLGAVETDRYGALMHVSRTRGDVAAIARIEAMRARRSRAAPASSMPGPA